MSHAAPPTPAGWYPDTEQVGGERYWDGTQWTESRRPFAAAAALPQPYAAPPKAPGSGLATAALVLGLIAIVFAFIPGVTVLAIILGLVAAILGMVALVRKAPARTRALIGTILGGVAFVLAIIMTVVYALAITAGAINAIDDAAIVPNPPAATAETAAPEVPSPEPTEQAPAAPAPVVAQQPFNGTGDSVIDIATNGLPAVVTFDCPACEGNTVLKTNGFDSLLVNKIGAWNGQYLIDTTTGSTTTTLTITATGDWAILVDDITSVPQTSGSAAGHGDRVVFLADEFDRAAITNAGESNFVVRGYGGGYADLAVNTIGSYTGTVPLVGPGFIQVTSEGDWTIAPG